MGSKLSVIPAALDAASAVIGRHALELASTPGSFESSTDSVGLAAASVHAAFRGFCIALSERLAFASTGLAGASGAFTAMESMNSEMLNSVMSYGDTSIRNA